MLTAVAQTEAAHFGKCPVCGALVDMQDLAQVMAKRGSRINPERRYSAYQAVFVAKLSRPHTVHSSDIAPRPGFTVAKPSGDHIPLGGFVLHNEGFCARCQRVGRLKMTVA
jgi:hypothetical protein